MYENKIGITITAVDMASEVVAKAAAEIQGASQATKDVVIASNDEMMASYRKLAAVADTSAAQQDASGALGKGGAGRLGGIAGAFSNPYVAAGTAITGALAIAVKSAADFQAQITRLYTTAGETAPLSTLRNGILAISDATGATTDQLTMGLYHISSAGYNAAGGLNILKAAAEGARAENADLSDVANALVTTMHDFGASSNQATSYMDMLIKTTSLGNMTLQDLASSLSTVLPKAKEAGLSFSQVGAAMATLTEGGVSADQAAQDLAAVIQGLVAPTAQQTKTMEQMGLDATSLSKNLGKVGLTGTLDELMKAVTAHSKDGLIIQSAFQNATLATKDLNTELAASPPELQRLEQQLLLGSISFTQFRKEVRALPEALANLGQQFEGTYNKANSFNNQLVTAINNTPTVASELKTLTGQSDSLNAVLMLTGANQARFNANNKAIADSARNAGANIDGWTKVQNNLNVQVDELKAKVVNAGKAIGTELIPYVTDAVKVLNQLASAIGDAVGKLGQLGSGIAKLEKDGSTNKGSFIDQVAGKFLHGFASGGFTGTGGMNDVAGVVHKGEYVVPQSGVDQKTGLPKAMGGGVVIQNLNVYNNTDVGLVTRQIGWQLANAV